MSKDILYIGFYDLPDKNAAANRVMNNARALRACGHNVIFIDEQVEYKYESIEKSLHKIDGFDVWTLRRPNSFNELLVKMISIDQVIKVIGQYEKIDLIIAYNYPSIALRKLLGFCHKNGIKLAADCTEWYSGKEYNFPKNFMSAADSFYRMRIVQKKLDGIIGISSFLCDYYKKEKNVLFIPPLVDKQNVCWQQEKYDFDNNILNLVYIGNPGKSKESFSPIFKAINDSKNKERIILRIVGITEEQFINLAPEAVNHLQNSKNGFQFFGRLSHDESLKLLRSSDFMIFFRENNRVTKAGFSTKFVEAISSGTSVITTNTGDLEQYFKKLNCGYLISNNLSLDSILDKDINELKEKAHAFNNTNIFDFRGYISELGKWVDQVNS